MMGRGPDSRGAGWVFATSASGGALLPWLTGILSTHAGSLPDRLPCAMRFTQHDFHHGSAGESSPRRPGSFTGGIKMTAHAIRSPEVPLPRCLV